MGSAPSRIGVEAFGLDGEDASSTATENKKRSPPPCFPLAARASNRTVDAAVFLEMLRAGTAYLCERKEHVNRINVFPVPDSDTGTNMYLSMRGGLRQLFAEEARVGHHLGETATVFSEGVLMSSQGNSGVCTSHFFSELASELAGKITCSTSELVTAFRTVGGSMRKAMHDPAEGTYLTVVAACTEALASEQWEGEDGPTLLELFGSLEKHAKEALARTPEQLRVDGKLVLKARGVVDSGAQGWTYIMSGIFEALRNPSFSHGEYMVASDPNELEVVERAFGATGNDDYLQQCGEHCFSGDESLMYRYCTEVVFALRKDKHKDDVGGVISGFGDSLAVVQAGALIKAHIHCNDPECVFNAVRRYLALKRDLLKIKADDMQIQVRNGRLRLPNVSAAPTQVFWVSTLDPPSYIMPVAMPYILPFRAVLDGEPYFDRTEISSRRIADITRRQAFSSFTTCGVGMPVYRQAFERAFAREGCKEVLVLLMPRYLSLATAHNAENARDLLPPEQRNAVTIWNSCYIGAPGGDAVAASFELAARGKSASEIVAELERRQDRHCFTYASGIRGLVRSGRVPVTGKNRLILPIALALNLRVVGYLPWPRDELKNWPELVSRARETGQQDLTAVQKVAIAKNVKASWVKQVEQLLKRVPPGTEIDLLILTGSNEHLCRSLVERVSKHYKVRFLDFCTVSPSLLGSAWYPVIGVYARTVVPGDLEFGVFDPDKQ